MAARNIFARSKGSETFKFSEPLIMPRRPRLLLADYPLHIVQRGINREPSFFATIGGGFNLQDKVIRDLVLNKFELGY